jgi:hypothetical protein
MGNAWYVHPWKADVGKWLEGQGVSVPPENAPGMAPTPNQVLAALQLFPEYRARVRREDLNGKRDVVVELTRADGSYAITIRLIGVSADDRSAEVFVFEHFRETEELVRLVAALAGVCGALFLYDDSGCEKPIVVSPGLAAGPGSAGR